MKKFKKGDRVVLNTPNNVGSFGAYSVLWKKFWRDNKSTIFIIDTVHPKRPSYTIKTESGSSVYYQDFPETGTVAHFWENEIIATPTLPAIQPITFDEELFLL